MIPSQTISSFKDNVDDIEVKLLETDAISRVIVNSKESKNIVKYLGDFSTMYSSTSEC